MGYRGRRAGPIVLPASRPSVWSRVVIGLSKPWTRRPSSEVLTETDLTFKFHSLGENTEMGFIQRACGAEPLALFRFNTSSIANMIDALETRLAHLYTAEDLVVITDKSADQFICRSRHYNNDFSFLTLMSPKKMSLAAIRHRELKRTAYLKEHFLDDLAGEPKIFVRKGCDSLTDLRALRRALARYGSHVLLAVVVADASHPVGTVEWLEDGLLRGYVQHFKVCNRIEPHDVAGWVGMFKAAYRAIHPGVVYAPTKRLATGANMKPFDNADAREEIGTWFQPGRLVPKDRAQPYALLARREMPTQGLEPRQAVLFSAWVRVPWGFRGDEIAVAFQGLQTLHSHPADLKCRDRWQRIWATARVPRDGANLVAELRFRGDGGAAIAFAGWSFEAGVTPLPPPFAVRLRLATSLERSGGFGRLLAGGLGMAKRPSAARPRRPAPVDQTAESFRRAAEVLIARQDFVDADDLLSRALEVFPQDPALTKLYALSAHNSGRYAGAVVRWIKAQQLDPNDPMCMAGFASNLREHGATDRAIDVIETALARFPDDMIVLTEAARIAEADARPADALRFWDKAIALHGTHPEWTLGRDRMRLATT